jgi:hypothetical protein
VEIEVNGEIFVFDVLFADLLVARAQHTCNAEVTPFLPLRPCASENIGAASGLVFVVHELFGEIIQTFNLAN